MGRPTVILMTNGLVSYFILVLTLGLIPAGAAMASVPDSFAAPNVVGLSSAHPVNLQASGGQLFEAGSAGDWEKIPVPEGLNAFIRRLHPVDRIDKLAGGSYWFYARLHNDTSISQWVFNPYDTVADSFHVALYSKDGITRKRTGFIEDREHVYTYGVNLEIPPGETVDLLVLLSSRYYSGYPRLELLTSDAYSHKLAMYFTVFLSCFGALLVLVVYNLFIGAWTRDRSYIYYAAYLFSTIIAWAGAFNFLSYWFGIHSTISLISPFYLLMFFSVLYYIHFLELRTTRPTLIQVSYGFAFLCLALACLPMLFTPGRYMLLHSVVALVWACLALTCGIVRLREGYKPARFFVLAFLLVALGGLPSVMATLGVIIQIKNHYLITLVAQTLDMAVLALALADRINILRVQREEALRHAVDVQHKAANTEREANLKLQEALSISEQESEKKSEFLRMVSHELRTPLYSITSATEQWQDNSDDYAKRDLIGYIAYGVARLRAQIDNLVVFAETEADDLEPNRQAFELRPIIHRLIDKSRMIIADGVKIEVHWGDDVPIVYEGDGYLLEHLVRTVLDNACKYTVHGNIDLHLSWDAETEKLGVLLRDTGCGMTREQLRVVFNDFVQVSRGLDRDSEGLGLGLAICYRLCEILSTDFQIDSDLGVGTTVSIHVPLEAVSSKLKVVGSDDAACVSRKVLLVEDNDVNAVVMARMLEMFGYEVDRAESGQAALEMSGREDSYHLILMDIQMPIMDGITATVWIRRRGITTPIVAVSANSDMRVRRRCRDVGMNDFLVKPVPRSDIQRVLTRLLPATIDEI